MPKPPLMLCLKNPFKKAPLILFKDEGIGSVVLTIRDVSKLKEVVCYDFPTCIDNLRTLEFASLPFVIDVCTAKKLVVGQPKKSFKEGFEPWSLRRLLGEYIDHQSMKWLNDFIQLKISDPPPYEILTSIMSGFQNTWEVISTEMTNKGESARFLEIENPIYNIFLKTELEGIRVPQEALMNKLHELKELQYSNTKKLELDYGFLSQWIKTEMKWDDVARHCKLSMIRNELEYGFWEFAEYYSEYDPFLFALVSARKASLDYDALIKYAVDQYDKIYPKFDIMGTVTGRILVSSPGIQYLKKTSRSIFQPQEGRFFIYSDFDQFEPGIIASFSKDPKLLTLYNSGDIYEKYNTPQNLDKGNWCMIACHNP